MHRVIITLVLVLVLVLVLDACVRRHVLMMCGCVVVLLLCGRWMRMICVMRFRRLVISIPLLSSVIKYRGNPNAMGSYILMMNKPEKQHLTP